MKVVGVGVAIAFVLGLAWYLLPGQDPGLQWGEVRPVEALPSLGDPAPVGSRPAASHEPDGFVPIVEEEWESFDRYNWYHRITNSGNVEVRDGRIVWTYTAGMKGGHTPGGLVAAELRHGPYQYHRDEGVLLSEHFQGHQSGVNKLRYWSDVNPRTYVGFFGADDSRLTLGMNTQGWPMGATRIRWNTEGNHAFPTIQQATVARGIPHTIETLIYRGTPGNADGWVKAWLNGQLILDFRDLAIIREGERLDFSQVHFAPVWGGTGDVIEREQTLSIERSYVSVRP